jgi:hypothetical protein
VWPFKRNKKNKSDRNEIACTFCGGSNTLVNAYQGGDNPNPVRTWRGRRYLTCRCLDCGLDFYTAEPSGGLPPGARTDEDLIDEEALQAAEDALKRQAEDENDRRFR